MIQPPPSLLFRSKRVPLRMLAAMSLALAAALALSACGSTRGAKDTSARTTAERRVWFGNLEEGQTVSSPVTVKMKAANLVVEPAARGVTDGHGHFHILVDVPPREAPLPIPFDEQHHHFGGGDTVVTLALDPGEHTLTLQFAKGDHVPYDPQIAQTIRVIVADTADTDDVDPAAVPGAPAAVTPAAPGS